jgi:hypothetical protein
MRLFSNVQGLRNRESWEERGDYCVRENDGESNVQ